MRILRITGVVVSVIAALLVFGCGGGIETGASGDANDQNGDNQQELPTSDELTAPVVTPTDDIRRNTVTIDNQAECDIYDCDWYSDDGGDTLEEIPDDELDCDGSGDCDYTVPGLDPNDGEVEVNVVYTIGEAISPEGSATLDPSFREARYYGLIPEMALGRSIAVGDVTGDDVPDIIAGPGAGIASTDRRVVFFMGGSNLFNEDGDLEPVAGIYND